eukprot:9478455-Pyramimonas_sp.AAC.1
MPRTRRPCAPPASSPPTRRPTRSLTSSFSWGTLPASCASLSSCSSSRMQRRWSFSQIMNDR